MDSKWGGGKIGNNSSGGGSCGVGGSTSTATTDTNITFNSSHRLSLRPGGANSGAHSPGLALRYGLNRRSGSSNGINGTNFRTNNSNISSSRSSSSSSSRSGSRIIGSNGCNNSNNSGGSVSGGMGANISFSVLSLMRKVPWVRRYFLLSISLCIFI